MAVDLRFTARSAPARPAGDASTLGGQTSLKAIATIVTLVSVVVFASCASPPSDAHLLKQFDESREELEALLQELLTDPRMADLQMAHMLSGGLAAYEVSAAESSEYRQRLRQCNSRRRPAVSAAVVAARNRLCRVADAPVPA